MLAIERSETEGEERIFEGTKRREGRRVSEEESPAFTPEIDATYERISNNPLAEDLSLKVVPDSSILGVSPVWLESEVAMRNDLKAIHMSDLAGSTSAVSLGKTFSSS